MRVLHVSQPTEAGVANVVLSLLRRQVEDGWDVHLACPTDVGDLGRRGLTAGATVHEWEATRSPGPGIFGEARALRRVLRKVRPDVVLLHSSKAGLAGRLTIRGALPTAFMPHSWSFEAVEGFMQTASAAWERIAARWTTLDILVSQSEAQTGREARCLAPRTVVIPNGVDLGRWHPRDRQSARSDLGLGGDPLVVVVGRLARQKGQDVALRAWPRVRQAVPGARLVLVGDGPDREALRAQLVEGASLRPGGDPLPWFSAADIVLLPSRWEGMPLVLLEAMACGRCVVAADVAGVSEVLGGFDAVAPVEDHVAVADRIIARLRNPELRDVEADANRQRVIDAFDVRRSAGQVSECLRLLVRSGSE